MGKGGMIYRVSTLLTHLHSWKNARAIEHQTHEVPEQREWGAVQVL
jgi:hypothetical protein